MYYPGGIASQVVEAAKRSSRAAIFCGAWAGDLGLINRDFAHTMRRKAALRLNGLRLFHFITSEGGRFISTSSRLWTLPIPFSLIAYRM